MLISRFLDRSCEKPASSVGGFPLPLRIESTSGPVNGIIRRRDENSKAVPSLHSTRVPHVYRLKNGLVLSLCVRLPLLRNRYFVANHHDSDIGRAIYFLHESGTRLSSVSSVLIPLAAHQRHTAGYREWNLILDPDRCAEWPRCSRDILDWERNGSRRLHGFLRGMMGMEDLDFIIFGRGELSPWGVSFLS